MALALLDTSILVDILRKHRPALTWYAAQTQLGVSRVVWLEAIQGAWDKPSQERALRLLRTFELVELSTADAEWATHQLVQFNLSHNIDAFDCLIASASHRLQIPLYTQNLKHFTPLLGSLARSPY